MNPFLSAYALIDSESGVIQQLATQLSERSGTKKELIINTYYFVRDEIDFSIISPHLKASDVAELGSGDCYGKAKLQSALLRANGIACGLFVQELREEGMKDFFSSEALDILERPFTHTLCAVQSGNSWIKADATFNAELLNQMGFGDWRMAGPWSGDEDMEIDSWLLMRDLHGPLPAICGNDQEPPVRPQEICSILNEKISSFTTGNTVL